MTFIELYRELREYVPNLPIVLAQKIVNERYAAILNRRTWAAQVAQGSFEIPAPIQTGTVAATQGSTSMVFTGASLTTAVIGRQIKINGQAPILTIDAFDAGTQTATVAMPWPLANVSGGSYTIAQYYVTPPSDFKQFIVIVDPIRMWRIRNNVTHAEVNAWDPARTNVGDPAVVADLFFNGSGRPVYELWPGPSTQRGYTYLYQKAGSLLVNDDDEPIYPLRGTELVKGALADLTKWPGTISDPNPLFVNASSLYPIYQKDFEDQMAALERQDDDIYLNSWTVSYYGNLPYAPFDSAWMQSHGVPALSVIPY